MRVGREPLVLKALCVVAEAADAASRGPVEPSLGLRLALAFLYAVSDGDLGYHKEHREIFDDFWKTIRSAGLTTHPQSNYMRGSYARTCLHQICRQVRLPYTVALSQRINGLCRKPPSPLQSGWVPSDDDVPILQEVALMVLADAERRVSPGYQPPEDEG